MEIKRYLVKIFIWTSNHCWTWFFHRFKGCELFVIILRGYNYLHSNSHLHVLKEILLNPCVVSSVVFNPVTSHVVLLPVQHRRQVRFGSKHGHLDTLNTRVYPATLWRVFEFKRVWSFDKMSVQQCLACNAMVSLPCVVDRLLLARTSFSVVCLWIHVLQLSGKKTTEFTSL